MPQDDAPLDHEVLLCYRGKYREQVELLSQLLRERGLRVSFDHEVLAQPGSGERDASIPWFSVESDSKGPSDEDETWRAPLRRAIESAELTVFLIPPTDISNNVRNEIQWVAQTSQNIFVIFDSEAEHSTTEKAIHVSTIHIALASGRAQGGRTADSVWKSHAFGFHFVKHSDPAALAGRLQVAANRICTYLWTVRQGPIDELDMRRDIHIEDLDQQPWVLARKRLRMLQTPASSGLASEELDDDAYRLVLRRHRDLESLAQVRQGLIMYPGSPYRYPAQEEMMRLGHTESIIDRVQPGHHEDAAIFSRLAAEAAAVELVVREFRSEARHSTSALIVLGTRALMPSPGFFHIEPGEGYLVIIFDRDFMKFAAQLSGIAVLATRLPSAHLGSQGAARALDGMLSSFLLNGHTMTVRPPPSPLDPEIDMLARWSIRFLVARAYAYLSLVSRRYPKPPASQLPSEDWKDRPPLGCVDRVAAYLLMRSVSRFDGWTYPSSTRAPLIVWWAEQLLRNACVTLGADQGRPRIPQPVGRDLWASSLDVAQREYADEHDKEGQTDAAAPTLDHPYLAALDRLWNDLKPGWEQRRDDSARLHFRWDGDPFDNPPHSTGGTVKSRR